MSELDELFSTSDSLNKHLNEKINELQESVHEHLNSDEEYKKYILTQFNIFASDLEEKLANLNHEKSVYTDALEQKEKDLAEQQLKIEKITEEMSNANADKDKLQGELDNCHTEIININQEKTELEETQKHFMEKISDLNGRILTVAGIIQENLNNPNSKITNKTLENILQKLSAQEHSGGNKKRKKSRKKYTKKSQRYKKKSKKRRKYKINNY